MIWCIGASHIHTEIVERLVHGRWGMCSSEAQRFQLELTRWPLALSVSSCATLLVFMHHAVRDCLTMGWR